jgi:hypothetical protein
VSIGFYKNSLHFEWFKWQIGTIYITLNKELYVEKSKRWIPPENTDFGLPHHCAALKKLITASTTFDMSI